MDGHFYGSVIDILENAAPVLILSIGMTLVIATGGVDCPWFNHGDLGDGGGAARRGGRPAALGVRARGNGERRCSRAWKRALVAVLGGAAESSPR